VEALTGKPFVIDNKTMATIRSQLMRTGQFPLNVDGLLGVLALPQVSGLVVTTDITNLPANLYKVNTMAVATSSPADTLYYNKLDGSGNHVWQPLKAAGPANMMTTDTTQSVTGTKSWTVGQINSSSQFGAGAFAGAVQALTSGLETKINLNSEIFDRGNCHDPAANNTRITVPVGGGGTWLFIGHVAFAANAVGERQAALVGNNVANIARQKVPACATGITVVEVMVLTTPVDLDYVELTGLQTSGGNLNTDVTGFGYTNLSGYKLC
jgi:hypothetical protein